ncbi:putative only prolin and serin are matching in the corresponding protein [Eutypa lata UCREL1]|uniref:Putative only prolin and serin are matching in the corresponding protein n=1 Tax=Eutypa lata (strain UCR-EL1) TaxID=1287681 RepID=M7SG87_EUTLA|nr:putative only prolin and serin are matching in the corresponding protein [Eutypa lata UCREL1]
MMHYPTNDEPCIRESSELVESPSDYYSEWFSCSFQSSFQGSFQSFPFPVAIWAESVDELNAVNDLCASIQRERALATTPLLPFLPPMNTTPHSRSTALPSPLESPTIASPFGGDSHSPTIISPPLSTKPSISSFHGLTTPVDLPSIPEPDAWSDRLGHANFTIVPQPYEPKVADEFGLHQFHLDWDSARVNYTKHLARTGEHYGVNSKTYVLTEAKWAEIDRTWRKLHDGVTDAIVASGVAAHCTQCDENIPTTMPNLNAEGKFPERGDEDIVGPMVRQASMTDVDRKRPSLWRRFTGPLRK